MACGPRSRALTANRKQHEHPLSASIRHGNRRSKKQIEWLTLLQEVDSLAGFDSLGQRKDEKISSCTLAALSGKQPDAGCTRTVRAARPAA
jgi:hypothetical protein